MVIVVRNQIAITCLTLLLATSCGKPASHIDLVVQQNLANRMSVPVQYGEMNEQIVLDTGATSSVLPLLDALDLGLQGLGEWIGETDTTIAGDSQEDVFLFLVYEMKVGPCILRNTPVMVFYTKTLNQTRLLGMPELARLDAVIMAKERRVVARNCHNE